MGGLGRSILNGLLGGERPGRRANETGIQKRTTESGHGCTVEVQAAMLVADLTDVVVLVDCCILGVVRILSRPCHQIF